MGSRCDGVLIGRLPAGSMTSWVTAHYLLVGSLSPLARAA
jgi:hypothetical protein